MIRQVECEDLWQPLAYKRNDGSAPGLIWPEHNHACMMASRVPLQVRDSLVKCKQHATAFKGSIQYRRVFSSADAFITNRIGVVTEHPEIVSELDR